MIPNPFNGVTSPVLEVSLLPLHHFAQMACAKRFKSFNSASSMALCNERGGAGSHRVLQDLKNLKTKN